MRKFALYRDPPDFDDHLGDCLPLNGPHVYLVGPAGLGLNISPQIAGFDNFFYKKIKKSSFDPETVSGTVIFYDEDVPKNAYFYYRQFVSFCTHAKKLYFGYAPFANDDPDDMSESLVNISVEGITIRSSLTSFVSFENDGIYIAGGSHPVSQESTLYKADAEFVSIEKTELDLYGTLQCPVEFTLLTPWYDSYHQVIIPEGVYGQASYTVDEIIGEIRGDLEGSFKFDLEVSCTAFSWAITNPDTSEDYFRFSSINYPEIFDSQESVYGKIEYSSKKDDSYFRFIDLYNDVEYNLLDYLDITSDIFKKIPIGNSVKLDLYVMDVGIVSISCQLFDYYRSV